MPTAYCPLTAVAMRSEPSHRAEMVNQLLFGDCMWITEREYEWLKVRLFYDDYEGWVSTKQVVQTDYLPKFDAMAIKLTTIFFNGTPMTIQPGSYYNSHWLATERKEEPATNSSVAVARQFLGAPYLWGGRTMLGIDCSGLTQVTYKICGIKLRRDASMQATQGKTVTFEERRAGDLGFFSNGDGKIIHVGIVMDNDKIIHASGKVRIDRLDTTGILNTETGEYSHQLSEIRRVGE